MEAVFLLMALSVIAALYLGTGKNRWLLFAYTFWGIALWILTQSGYYLTTHTLPPRFATVILPALAAALWFYKKIEKVSIRWLIAVHIIRIPVELCLHQLFLQRLLPESMTYTGYNFDILSGISAIVILVLHLTGKLPTLVFKVWNLLALTLLAIVVVTAVLSIPTAVQVLSFDQPNRAVLLFPYILLPGVIVPLVILSHLLLLKNLRK